MNKKGKRRIWVFICVTVGIVVAGALILFKIFEPQENIFFTEYESEYEIDDTIIYQYDSKNNTVTELGRVPGEFLNCVINRDETYITGVTDGGVFEIVRYDLIAGTTETLDAEEKIAALTDNNVGWDNSLLYDGGNKIFVSFEDESGKGKWLLYDLTTDQYDIVEEETIWFLSIHNNSLWYIADGVDWYHGSLYQYDLERKEKTKVMESAHYDSVVMPETGLVAYTKDIAEKQIYLYDMRTQESSCITDGGWNTFYGDLDETNSRWSDNGNEFYYIEYFPGLFNEATTKLMVYNVITHRSRCIYKVKMTAHPFRYVMKR